MQEPEEASGGPRTSGSERESKVNPHYVKLSWSQNLADSTVGEEIYRIRFVEPIFASAILPRVALSNILKCVCFCFGFLLHSLSLCSSTSRSIPSCLPRWRRAPSSPLDTPQSANNPNVFAQRAKTGPLTLRPTWFLHIPHRKALQSDCNPHLDGLEWGRLNAVVFPV